MRVSNDAGNWGMGRGRCLLKGEFFSEKVLSFTREEDIYKSFIIIFFLQNEETKLNKSIAHSFSKEPLFHILCSSSLIS